MSTPPAARQPWSTDHPIDHAFVSAWLGRQIGADQVQSVELLGAGWDFSAWLLTRADGLRLVVRFPKRAREMKRLARERLLLPWLKDRFPLTLPVPEQHFEAETIEGGFPWAVAAYRMVEGRQAIGQQVSRAAGEAIAEKVGRALVALGRIHPLHAGLPEGLAGLLPREDYTTEMEWAREEAERKLPTLGERFAGERRRLLLAELGRMPAAWTGAPVLSHADLWPEHLILDDSDTLVGIIDWGDVCWGDPAWDLAGLAGWLGMNAVRRAAGEVGLDEAACQRARYLALCRGVQEWWYGLTAERPLYAAQGRQTLERLL